MGGTVSTHSADQIVIDVAGVGILMAFGNTVPSDGKPGYAPGCLFLDVNATGSGNVLFVNIGSVTSCDFDGLTVP